AVSNMPVLLCPQTCRSKRRNSITPEVIVVMISRGPRSAIDNCFWRPIMTAQALTLHAPRFIYRFDAALSLTMGFALILLAAPLAALIGGAPRQMFLVGAGIFLVPWAFFNWPVGAAAGPARLSL